MPRPRPSNRHPDLFAPKGPPAPATAAKRAELLPLVSALLTEILAALVTAEGRDEDHA